MLLHSFRAVLVYDNVIQHQLTKLPPLSYYIIVFKLPLHSLDLRGTLSRNKMVTSVLVRPISVYITFCTKQHEGPFMSCYGNTNFCNVLVGETTIEWYRVVREVARVPAQCSFQGHIYISGCSLSLLNYTINVPVAVGSNPCFSSDDLFNHTLAKSLGPPIKLAYAASVYRQKTKMQMSK